jgi:hypothetical protein
MAGRAILQINVGFIILDSMYLQCIQYFGKGSEKHAYKSALMLNI